MPRVLVPRTHCRPRCRGCLPGQLLLPPGQTEPRLPAPHTGQPSHGPVCAPAQHPAPVRGAGRRRWPAAAQAGRLWAAPWQLQGSWHPAGEAAPPGRWRARLRPSQGQLPVLRTCSVHHAAALPDHTGGKHQNAMAGPAAARGRDHATGAPASCTHLQSPATTAMVALHIQASASGLAVRGGTSLMPAPPPGCWR